jgi:hypothetical protein
MSPAEFLQGRQRFQLGPIRCRSQQAPGPIQDFPAYDVKHSPCATPYTLAPVECSTCPLLSTLCQPSRGTMQSAGAVLYDDAHVGPLWCQPAALH